MLKIIVDVKSTVKVLFFLTLITKIKTLVYIYIYSNIKVRTGDLYEKGYIFIVW